MTFVVNGTPRPVQNTAQCKAAANWVIANLGSDQDGISVNLSAGAVQTLTLGTIEGVPVTYNDSQPGLKPTVTKTGSTYKDHRHRDQPRCRWDRNEVLAVRPRIYRPAWVVTPVA